MVSSRTRFRILLAAILAGAAAISAGVYCAIRLVDSDFPALRPPRGKTFVRPLAEDVSIVRDDSLDTVKFRSCRLEKRKSGILTLAAMNVLVIEDLDVVLAADSGSGGVSADGDGQDGSQEGKEGRKVVRRLGISDGFLSAHGLPYRFSGVRISGLSVSRFDGSSSSRIFTASSAVSTDGGLSLSGVRLNRDGATEKVSRASLSVSGGALRLSWSGGSIPLP